MRFYAPQGQERDFLSSLSRSFNQRCHRREMHKVEDVRLVERLCTAQRRITTKLRGLLRLPLSFPRSHILFEK